MVWGNEFLCLDVVVIMLAIKILLICTGVNDECKL